MVYRLWKSGRVELKEGEPPVTRNNQPELRPWAVTPEGDVVYADWGLEQSDAANPGAGNLLPYDKNVSQKRRRLFESELARHAAQTEFSREAVSNVSQKLIKFVEDNLPNIEGGTEAIGKVIKAFCFGDTKAGRLGTNDNANAISEHDAWLRARDALLNGNDISKVLLIQRTLANQLQDIAPLDKVRRELYDAAAVRVCPAEGHLYSWFKPGQSLEDKKEDAIRRGRVKAAQVAEKDCALPGITRPGDGLSPEGVERRERGVDAWEPLQESRFAKGLDLRNLVFGAGRSGTTAELLKTYRTFGGADSSELFKKYLFAIVASLVGGGHHTCHEVFSVANLLVGAEGPRGNNLAPVARVVSDSYVPGKYIKHLPDGYLNSNEFKNLREKYYDIAVLGHLHGIFS